MKKFLLFAGILFLFSTLLYGENANEGGEVYIIQRGDTLWDLAQQFYHNPWLWPRLWEANPYIENPHLIFPGKPLAVPKILPGPPPAIKTAQAAPVSTTAPVPSAAPVSTTAPVPSAAPAPSTAPSMKYLRPATGVTVPPPVEQVAKPLPGERIPQVPPSPQIKQPTMPQQVNTLPEEIEEPTIQTIVLPQPKPIHYFVRIGSEGFISKYELRSYGKITASDSEKVLYSQGDYVYINMGESAGVISGDKFTVFEVQSPVYSPRYKRKIGYLVRVKGFLEVKEVYKDISKALIIQSFDAIMIGDSINPYERFPHHIEVKKSEANAKGYIIGIMDNKDAAGEGDIVYCDIGKKDGVEIGNVVEIYEPAREVYDPTKGIKEHIPPLLVGKAVMLSTQEGTSVGLIFRSYREIYKDYGVRLVSEY